MNDGFGLCFRVFYLQDFLPVAFYKLSPVIWSYLSCILFSLFISLFFSCFFPFYDTLASVCRTISVCRARVRVVVARSVFISFCLIEYIAFAIPKRLWLITLHYHYKGRLEMFFSCFYVYYIFRFSPDCYHLDGKVARQHPFRVNYSCLIMLFFTGRMNQFISK